MSYGYDDDDAKKRKRYVIITISSVLLISMVVAVTVGVSLNKEDNGDGEGGNGQVTASVKAIKEVCAPTDYKKTCEDTLRKNANNTSDPLELVKTAFEVTMKQIAEAAAKSKTLIEIQKDPRTKMALDQCKELMDYAFDELKSSFDELGKFEFHKLDEALINLRIWLSAAISHETTCLEGFEQTQGNAGETMKKALKTAIQLTHNGLAIVTEMSDFVGQMQISGLNSRRLLSSNGYPSWVDARARRLLAATVTDVKPDIVVAQDGSGQYATINEALEHVPKKKNVTFVVHIKAGVYKEYIQVNKSMTDLVFIGDGPDKTIISGDKGFKDGITTYRTQTVAIVGDRFIAKDIGFENTAGAIKHQAVAVRVQSDMSVFYNCRFDGYQDTLYTHSHRQFFRDCTISGTIDFLFGDAAAVFQNCTLLVRKPLPNQACPITAHGRQDPREPTGFVFQGCQIAGEPDYLSVKATSKAYLGRPWKAYSRTIIMNTFIPDFVQPQGWQPWNGDFGLSTLFYSEIQNTGPGSDVVNRVTWAGIKKLTNNDLLQFTPAQFIQGDSWIPATGVPYTPGFFAGTGSPVPVAASGPVEATSTGFVQTTLSEPSTAPAPSPSSIAMEDPVSGSEASTAPAPGPSSLAMEDPNPSEASTAPSSFVTYDLSPSSSPAAAPAPEGSA
ncbi:PREDICTED: probable pectinesterase/pectinesterase inhibitor 21 [Tarenaya hassleriana]|uniref:probable pectinesterase/pectinesterase inhibitor 21 n=1 Tax=Tarenaya hassleriana TaxID=28532 RepID=UPI00053C7B77|nr:PREDICTED: probable pectinesterase/pectinesterase inhibitor 21 [Tarenaya hassleriana]